MEAALDQPVLVLNRLWQAVNVIGARRAFGLLARGHAQVVHHHDEDFRTFGLLDWIDFSTSNPPLAALEMVHTPSRTIRWKDEYSQSITRPTWPCLTGLKCM